MNAPTDILLPPHSIEAEQSLIGGLLIDHRAWDAVAGVVTDGDFYRDDHRRIFRHIARLAEAGQSPDVVTVADAIEQANEVDQTGGLAYLGEIANETPSAANIRRHAEIVRERAVLRRLISAAGELEGACFRPGQRKPAELVAAAEAAFAQVLDQQASEPADLSTVLNDAVVYIDCRGDVGGLRTGFRDFDALTGGLEPGQLVVVAARPSMGKTVFGVNVADQVARAGGAVLFQTLEMSRREIGMRILAARSGVPMRSMRSGTKEHAHWDRMADELKPATTQRLWFDDTPAVGVPYVRARARRLKRTKGLDLIVIDYLGLMRGQGENRVQEIGSISRGLKALAKELQVPIIALAQLNRGVEGRPDKRPLMSDLRDSGEIEQDADIVAMLHREAYHRPDAAEWAGVAELLVRKNRNGPTGDVLLSWFPEEMRFDAYRGANPRQHADANASKPPRKGRSGFSMERLP